MDYIAFLNQYARPAIEISLIAVMLYYFYLLIQKTKAVYVLRGLVFLGLGFFVAKFFNLYTIDWILTQILTIAVIAFLVIFQPELRYILEWLGQGYGTYHPMAEENIVDVLVRTAFTLGEKKIGALIVVERKVGLKNYMSAGIMIDGKVSFELLHTIFMPHTPLHDGGVIIRDNRVAAASCLFPLSQRPDLSKSLGTRHRAAVGLSEETDAIVLVVSEETGVVSMARDGSITRNMDRNSLTRVLSNLYSPEQTGKKLKELSQKA